MMIQWLLANNLFNTFGVLSLMAVIALGISGLLERKERREKIAHIGAAGWYLTPAEVSQFYKRKR